MAGINHFRLRWNDSLAREMNEKIDLSYDWRGERLLPPSPFGNTESGLFDYRGFPLKVQLRRLVMTEVDFSFLFCVDGGSLNSCQVKRSNFTQASFDGRFFGSMFENCDFSKISLKNSAIGGTIFLGCVFDGANLTGSMARGAKFIDCSFRKTNFGSAHLLHCFFDDCSFGEALFRYGPLAESRFASTSPGDAQLEDTILVRCVWDDARVHEELSYYPEVSRWKGLGDRRRPSY